MKPEYGKVTTKESYHAGQLRSKSKWFEESFAVETKQQILKYTLEIFDLFLTEESDEVEISIKRNTEGKLRLVKRWLVDLQ